MANVKITELTELAAVDIATNDVLPIVDLGADSTKKVSIASLTTQIADPVEARRADNTFFTYNTSEHTNVVINTANVEPSSNNTQLLGAPDKVWKEIYIGPGSINLGAVTIRPHSEEGIQIIGSSGESANIFTTALGGVANVSQQFIDVDTRLSTNATAFTNEDTALQSRLTTNVTAFTNEDTALQSRLTTNVTAFTNEDTALQARIAANTLVAASNDFITYTRLNANLDIVQDNVAAIIDGSTAFTGEVTMNDDLVISGNLIVNGSQVDLGVTTATISNNLIELSAELGPSDSPTTDSGLLINRGNEGNVFIGKSVAEDGVIFAHTLSPDTTVTIAIDEFMDAHANAFHAAADPSLSRVHFGLRSAEDTGIVIDDSSANVNFIADGSYIANVHYDGTINSQNAIISPKVFANGVDVNSELTGIETRRTANIAGAISSVLTSDLTADRVMITDGSGKISQSSGVTPTELDYLDGITLGTTAASKVVTSDAVGDTNFTRDVDIDGNVTIGTNSSNTVTITGSIDLGALS